MKKTFFKVPFSRKSKSSVWNTNFISGHGIPIFFLLYTLIRLVILHTGFGLIWTTPWPDENGFLNKILKNSQFAKFAKFRIKTHFFPRKAIPTTFLLRNLITLVTLKKFRLKFQLFCWASYTTKILFALHYHYTVDTQYRVWFDLDNSLTLWKRTIFKFRTNSQFKKFAKFRIRTQLFS